MTYFHNKSELDSFPKTEVEFFNLIKDDVDRGETKHRIAANGLDAGNTQKLHGQRIADLILDILR